MAITWPAFMVAAATRAITRSRPWRHCRTIARMVVAPWVHPRRLADQPRRGATLAASLASYRLLGDKLEWSVTSAYTDICCLCAITLLTISVGHKRSTFSADAPHVRQREQLAPRFTRQGSGLQRSRLQLGLTAADETSAQAQHQHPGYSSGTAVHTSTRHARPSSCTYVPRFW
jgi:hypothetical protein